MLQLLWLIHNFLVKECSSCRTCLHVFIQYPAPDRGLCNIQQLVATAFSLSCTIFLGTLSTYFQHIYKHDILRDAAKFLTGASAVGSMAIPIILRHAGLIRTGAMIIEFTSFFIFVCTLLCFHRASLLDEW